MNLRGSRWARIDFRGGGRVGILGMGSKLTRTKNRGDFEGVKMGERESDF